MKKIIILFAIGTLGGMEPDKQQTKILRPTLLNPTPNKPPNIHNKSFTKTAILASTQITAELIQLPSFILHVLLSG